MMADGGVFDAAANEKASAARQAAAARVADRRAAQLKAKRERQAAERTADDLAFANERQRLRELFGLPDANSALNNAMDASVEASSPNALGNDLGGVSTLRAAIAEHGALARPAVREQANAMLARLDEADEAIKEAIDAFRASHTSNSIGDVSVRAEVLMAAIASHGASCSRSVQAAASALLARVDERLVSLADD